MRAFFVTNTTANGMYLWGVRPPMILRIARVGTTISGYVSMDNGRTWGRIGNAVTASTDFQRVGILGYAGDVGTTQKLVALVHWLRKF